jgi:glucokinase
MPCDLCLVGDVGATYARFALHDQARGSLEQAETLRCDDYPDLVSAVEHYLAQTGAPRPVRAAIAVACTVTEDEVEFVNRTWSFSIAHTKQRLGMDELLVMNDFYALALSLPYLSEDDLMRVGGGEALPECPRALVGPGSGLGMSFVVPTPSGLVPIATEGGYATFAAQGGREQEVIDILRKRFNGHVSQERVCSGPGLPLLYEALCELDGQPQAAPTPAEIVERACTGSCERSSEVVSMFCAALGTVAGNAALMLGARGGVYIAGGIVPRLGELFAASPFRARFESKGRYSYYVKATPTWVIRHPHPALLGAAHALRPPSSE